MTTWQEQHAATLATWEAFTRAHGLAFTCHRIDTRPGTDVGAWDRDAQHYRTVIRRGHRRMVVTFSQGNAHTTPPTLVDVLSCIALDAQSVENARTFEEWAADFGYNADSRKGERIFRAIERQAKALARLLNDEERKALYALEGL